MAIQRKDHAQNLEKGVRTNFTIGALDYSPLRDPFTRMMPSDGSFEDYADMGAPPWPIQNAGKAGDGGLVDETQAVKVGSVNAGENIKIVTSSARAMRITNLDWEMAYGIWPDKRTRMMVTEMIDATVPKATAAETEPCATS